MYILFECQRVCVGKRRRVQGISFVQVQGTDPLQESFLSFYEHICFYKNVLNHTVCSVVLYVLEVTV